ncbi:MAG: hypothetical protein RDV41_04085 [Planctomycetota bacterium]|nr:hypothetical protein [Planctomycetota bacterium]
MTKIKYELEILGMSATGHPLEGPEPPDAARAVNSTLQPATNNVYTPLAELNRHVGRTVSIRGWFVTARRIITKHGKLMMFVTLEDAGAVAEVTLFPTAYQRFGYVMERAGTYLVSGKVDDHGNIEGRRISAERG